MYNLKRFECDFDDCDLIVQVQAQGEREYQEIYIKKDTLAYLVRILGEGDFLKIEFLN